MNALSRYFVVNSSIFQVVVEAKIGEYTRRYEALVQRRGNQITTLYFRAL